MTPRRLNYSTFIPVELSSLLPSMSTVDILCIFSQKLQHNISNSNQQFTYIGLANSQWELL
jgi:hypothetical protein